jgi:hypothetical protein
MQVGFVAPTTKQQLSEGIDMLDKDWLCAATLSYARRFEMNQMIDAAQYSTAIPAISLPRGGW